MKVDLEKETCPYCGEIMFLNFYACEYFCPDCRKSFARITGEELDKKGNIKKVEENDDL